MLIASKKQKLSYDHRIKTLPYKEGDKVWLTKMAKCNFISPKLQAKWEGPFVINKKKFRSCFSSQKINEKQNSGKKCTPQ